jgi:hypothetical protein
VIRESNSKAAPIIDLSDSYNKASINPWFITGLVDGDGTMNYQIQKASSGAWKVKLECSISAFSTSAN